MDTTMQSPVRWKIPLPSFAGIEGPDFDRPEGPDNIEIPIPSGPHTYSNKTWVGRVSDGITPKQAFESLSRHATPFQGGVPSIDGGTVDIPMFGKVRQMVDPERMTIVNTTEPGHILYPGNVHRSIVQEGTDIYVLTHGFGTGFFPKLNEKVAPLGWSFTDGDIRNELNPELDPAKNPIHSPMNYSENSLQGPVFSQMMSTGLDSPFAGNKATQDSPPLQPDEAQDTTGNGRTRFLVGRVYDPSQGPPPMAQPAPAPAAPDGSLSINDAYLEYLKRLNAN